jgi:hypothetical protein
MPEDGCLFVVAACRLNTLIVHSETYASSIIMERALSSLLHPHGLFKVKPWQTDACISNRFLAHRFLMGLITETAGSTCNWIWNYSDIRLYFYLNMDYILPQALKLLGCTCIIISFFSFTCRLSRCWDQNFSMLLLYRMIILTPVRLSEFIGSF